MKQLVVWLAVLATAALVTTGSKSAPLDAYGHLPTLSNVAISPDGSELAFVERKGTNQAVVAKSIDNHQTLASIAIGDRRVAGLSWAGPNHLLVTQLWLGTVSGIFGTRREWFVVQDYNLKTQKFVTLLENAERGITATTDPPTIRIVDGRPLAFLASYSFESDYGTLTLFRVDLDTGETTVVRTGDGLVYSWLLDERGQVVALAKYDNSIRHWHLTLRGHENLKEAYGADASIDVPEAFAFGPDGKTILISEVDNNVLTYKQLNVDDAKVSTLTQWGTDVTTVIYDPLSWRVIATESAGPNGSVIVRFLAAHDQAIWNGIVAAFAGESLTFIGMSADKSRIIVLVDGPHDVSEYELVDRTTHTAEPIGPAYSGVGPADVATVRFVTYTASDGLQIPAYLTLPNGRQQNNLPLVVLPHSSASERDEPGFDWWAQAIASRGYAVLQPEFRGSDGFGWNYVSAGFGQWGRKMQSDLSDGVRYLVAQGIVDPGRVCIVGSTYGGYAALAGAALNHGVYKCAVSYAGISDPRTWLQFEKDRYNLHDDLFLRFWKRFMGLATLDDPSLSTISPLAHANDVSIPILLMYSKTDTVIPFEQSEQMETALRSSGKNVTSIRLDGEDHWLLRSEGRERMLQATVEFLEANNPPN